MSTVEELSPAKRLAALGRVARRGREAEARAWELVPELYASGAMTPTQIAEALGVTPRTVHRHLEGLARQYRTDGGRHRPEVVAALAVAGNATMQEAWEACGGTLSGTARALGLTRETVRLALRREGAELHRATG